jgi:hypothetical protein
MLGICDARTSRPRGGGGVGQEVCPCGIRLDGEWERPRDIPEPGPPTSVEATEVLDIP